MGGSRWNAWADAAVLVAVAALLRAPFVSGWLWAWDSILYARAVRDFHLGAAILDQRPHPPGYALYVFTARALSAVAGDERAGLVVLSVVAGALVVAVGYAVGRAIAGRRAGIATAVVLLADPVLWHASEIAYPYVLLALLGGGIGLLAWRARALTGVRWIVLLGGAFGLALGFRQDLLLHVGPLVAWTLWRTGRRAMLAGAIATATASLLWLVPSAAAAGGLDRYLALVDRQAYYASSLDGVPPPPIAIAENLRLAALGLGWQLLWLWPLAAGGALVLWRRRPDVVGWLALWEAPTLLVLVFLHTGEPGYALAVAVPSAALVGVFVERALSLPRPRVAVVALGAATAVLVVLLGATFFAGHGRFSASAIRRHDRILAEQVEHIRSRYAPSETLIVGGANYMHAVWYLSDYTAFYAAPRREGGSARELARAMKGRRYAVLFDDSHPLLRRLADRTRLAGDIDLYVIRVRAAALEELDQRDPLSDD